MPRMFVLSTGSSGKTRVANRALLTDAYLALRASYGAANRGR